MYGKSNSGSAFVKTFSYIVVFLLILGILGGVSYFVLKNQGFSYYVEYAGTKYYGNTDGGKLSLPPADSPYVFSVKSLTGDNVNYSVKVLSNSANNFTFVQDGEPKKFYGTDEKLNDYSDIFGLEKNDDSFSLTVPKDLSVVSAIEQKYGGEIELQDELKNDTCYFLICVSVENSSVNLWFNIDPVNIFINPPQLIF